MVLEARLKTTTYSVRRTFYCFVVLNKETRLLATDSDNRTVDHSIKPFNGTACVKCSRPLGACDTDKLRLYVYNKLL